jgi:signal transduction histidine kinase
MPPEDRCGRRGAGADLGAVSPGAGGEVQTGVGLGLGLYISRMIVQRHHGQVGVDSQPGQGATFWFTLPLASSLPPNGSANL